MQPAGTRMYRIASHDFQGRPFHNQEYEAHLAKILCWHCMYKRFTCSVFVSSLLLQRGVFPFL